MTATNITLAPTRFEFDRALIENLDGYGPRYTSYPTADRFHDGFTERDYRHWLQQRQIGASAWPLSLYVHLPFCNTVCYYCACNKVITKDRSKADTYLDYVEKELALHAQTMGGGVREVAQLHFGGGTPTFLNDAQLTRLMAAIRQHFHLVTGGEFSIEIDPRKVSADTVRLLAELGFNRMSVGVQDFEPEVQQAVNRIQSEEETRLVINTARACGFKSVSIDLIYGLPLQAEVGLLTDAGYVFIGMDHFAKPDDDLSVALKQGRLQRNFQGYSTHADHDLIGIGVSAIGKVGPTYSQNVRTLDEYYAALDADRLPTLRGMVLTEDDILRRNIIQRLMCQFALSKEAIEEVHAIDFAGYFAPELEKLAEYEAHGMLSMDKEWITVTPKGRFLISTIAM